MTGQLLSLSIGINDYPGTENDLTGCVNDAHAWAAALKARGFSNQTLTDSDATRSAISEFMEAIVAATRYGDLAVITYSGHGSWVPDFNGDEPDKRDEALCPWDVLGEGVITDDDLHALFAQRHHGSRIVMISDSCHSGSVTRFAAPVIRDRPRTRFMPPEVHLIEEEMPQARAVASNPGRGKPRGGALLLAACADWEYAYDGYGILAQGAFTTVALEALEALPAGASYRQWMQAIRLRLPAVDIPQTPRLYGSSVQADWPVFAALTEAP